MTHWLTTTLIPTASRTAVATITAALVASCIVAPFRKYFRKFWRAVDSVDPATDTGVTKQLKQIARTQAEDPDAPLAKHGR